MAIMNTENLFLNILAIKKYVSVEVTSLYDLI